MDGLKSEAIDGHGQGSPVGCPVTGKYVSSIKGNLKKLTLCVHENLACISDLIFCYLGAIVDYWLLEQPLFALLGHK